MSHYINIRTQKFHINNSNIKDLKFTIFRAKNEKMAQQMRTWLSETKFARQTNQNSQFLLRSL